MQRVFGAAIYFFVVYALKFALFGDIAPHNPGLRLGRDAMVRGILPWFGARALGPDDLQTLMAAMGLYCFVLGYVFHFFMGDKGLGPNLNGAISLVGCFLVLLIYGVFVGQFRPSDINVVVVAAIVASAASVALVAVLRTLLTRDVETQAAGARPAAAKSEQNATLVSARLEALAARDR